MTAPISPVAAFPTPAHQLQLPASSFIGREADLAQAQHLLTTTRLLTLTGPPGIGKSRLALHLAVAVAAAFPGGLWLVELSTVNDPRLVPQQVAAVLGVREGAAPAAAAAAGDPLLAALLAFLAAQPVLLVLDNCEHLLAACAQFAETVLAACPQVRLLTTSRQGLGSPAETILRLAPLDLPPAAADATPARTAEGEPDLSAAARLFIDRTRAVHPSFALTPATLAAVNQICRRLDGIPLALELAAAHVPGGPLDSLADRLDTHFGPLSSRAGRAAPPRHQTLQATFDWSYDLLPVAERVVLRRLAVLGGQWTGETAVAVCSGEGLTDAAVQAGVAQLVDKSLVLEDHTADPPTYHWLATLRQYAAEKLRAAGELTWTRDRHLAVFLELAEAAAPHLQGAAQTTWLARLEADHANLRLALEWALAEEDAPTALRLSGALWRFWYAHSHLSEGRRWLEAALHAGDAPAPLRAHALIGAGVLAYMQGATTRAVARIEESLRLTRAGGDPTALADTLNSLAAVVQAQGDYERAGALLEESLALKRGLGDHWGTAASLGNLGLLAQAQADYPRARGLLQESLALFRNEEDTLGVANTLSNLGAVALAQGDAAQARQLGQEALGLWQELGDKAGLAQTLAQLAEAAAATGQAVHAAQLWGAVASLCAAIGAPLPARYEAAVAAAQAQLPAGAFTAAWAVGQARTLEETLAAAPAAGNAEA
ncbi:MAG: tetratricopeptide repeat protein [Chloroflexota bacterium]|nr:tetratricopeptide repeat protein [Chloroflexota bacterium]